MNRHLSALLILLSSVLIGGCSQRARSYGHEPIQRYVPEGVGRHTWWGALEVDGKIVDGVRERDW